MTLLDFFSAHPYLDALALLLMYLAYCGLLKALVAMKHGWPPRDFDELDD